MMHKKDLVWLSILQFCSLYWYACSGDLCICFVMKYGLAMSLIVSAPCSCICSQVSSELLIGTSLMNVGITLELLQKGFCPGEWPNWELAFSIENIAERKGWLGNHQVPRLPKVYTLIHTRKLILYVLPRHKSRLWTLSSQLGFIVVVHSTIPGQGSSLLGKETNMHIFARAACRGMTGRSYAVAIGWPPVPQK